MHLKKKLHSEERQVKVLMKFGSQISNIILPSSTLQEVLRSWFYKGSLAFF